MCQLTVGEKLSLSNQGAFGCTLRCDQCGKPILEPIVWKGKHNRSDYCTRDCRDEAEGRTTKLKRKYIDSDIGYIPLLGTDIDRIEQEVMKRVILQPHEVWNFNTISQMLKGTDRPSIRTAINNLIDDESLYRVGRTMSIHRPEEFRVEQKEHRRALRKVEVIKNRKKRKRERERLKAQ
jgi:hypothetical protein